METDTQEVMVTEVQGHSPCPEPGQVHCVARDSDLRSSFDFANLASQWHGLATFVCLPESACLLSLNSIHWICFTSGPADQVSDCSLSLPSLLLEHTHIHPHAQHWSNQPLTVLRTWALNLTCFCNIPYNFQYKRGKLCTPPKKNPDIVLCFPNTFCFHV